MAAQEEFTGTRPVADALAFDIDALAAYLRERLPGFRGPLTVEQFKGGQSNPTYKLTADGRAYVLRRKPPGKLLPSAHAVEREYRVISALAHTDVPVPQTYCLCEDAAVIGTPFYVMDFVDGRVLWDPALPGMTSSERHAIFDDMNRAIAALHNVDYVAAGLGDFGKAGNYFARQIDRWSRQYKASETEPIEAMDRLIAWLPKHIPTDERTCIVHGDYRLDNLVFHPNHAHVCAVLDWELSTLGHPMADFSYHLMTWRLGGDEFRGLRGTDLTALGIPKEDEYVELYLQRTHATQQPTASEWSFYFAYNLFRLAAILQGIMGRAVAGNAASARALDAGRRARPIAELGWKEVDRLAVRV
jgi:aminoglycoside phosphotransferase (APT) family kinase protein